MTAPRREGALEGAERSPTDRRRVDRMSVLASSGWVGAACIHLAMGRWLLLIPCGIGLSTLLVARWRWLALGARAADLAAGGTLAGVLGMVALGGGYDSPAASLLAAVPIFATLTMGARRGALWLGISLASLLSLRALPPWVTTYYPLGEIDELVALPSAITFVFVLAALMHRALAEAVQLAEQRAARARELADELRVTHREQEVAARAKAAFLATMSHEVRTPLSAMLGMTSVLETSDLPPAQREIVAALRSSGHALRSLVDDLLDLERLERGALTIERGVVEIEALLTGVVDLFGPTALDANLEIAAVVHPDVPTRMKGDPNRIRQILSNLVGNATKFTRTGSVVARATWDSEASALRIEVEDTGAGIEARRLERIFTPFAQGDSTVARRFGGSGLGLAISRQLAEAMNGSLRAQSVIGKGSTFTLTVPGEPIASDDRLAIGSLPRIGLVASSAAVRQGWEFAAARRSVPTHVAASLSEAVSWGRQVDVVVVDVVGRDLAAFERALNALDGAPSLRRKARVLAVTPSLLAAGREAARSSQAAVDLTMKPLSFARALAASCDAMASGEFAALAGGAAQPDSALHVLVVDDDRVNRMATRLMLTREGHQVREAESGASALAALDKESFDVIFLDLHMPDMLGTEVAQEIRARPLAGAPTPYLIAYTAAAFATDREACQAAGMDAFLTKPLDLAALHALLEEAGRRVRRERRATPVVDLAEGDFDWARLESLLSLCESRDEYREMVDTLSEQSAAISSALQDSVDRHDREAARDAAHKLAGMYATMGAIGVERDARATQTLATADERTEALVDAVARLIRSASVAERAIAARAARVERAVFGTQPPR